MNAADATSIDQTVREQLRRMLADAAGPASALPNPSGVIGEAWGLFLKLLTLGGEDDSGTAGSDPTGPGNPPADDDTEHGSG